MKGPQVILGHIGDAQVAVRLVDGRLDDVLVEDVNTLAPGTILRGVVDRPMKGMGGVMLRIPGGTAFLRKPGGLSAGQSVLCQVSGRAEEGKAIPVTTRLLFKSRYAIVTPDAPGLNVSRTIRDDDLRDALDLLAREAMDGSPHGLILRSACAGADVDDIAGDIAAMRDRADALLADDGQGADVLLDGDAPHAVAWREWSDVTDVLLGADDLENTGTLDALEQAQAIDVALSTGSMAVEATRALVAVDVNTGGATNPAAALKANLAAAADLTRQLRLRGLGGQIVVDFAPMTKRDRKPVEVALRKACRACPVATEFVGWTPLGHAELKRKRERVPVGLVVRP